MDLVIHRTEQDLFTVDDDDATRVGSEGISNIGLRDCTIPIRFGL